jgi:putative hydrolase of the HAD superfamily
MVINPKNTCLVLDLDDTLYKEYDYQTSGLKYIEEQVFKLYNVNLKGQLLRLREQKVQDIFLELTKILNIPPSTKASFLAMYRYHRPDIKLSTDTKKFLKSVLSDFKQVVILTDGRAVSQRLKLESLGLMKIPVFISEEWNSVKPDNKRFVTIMEKYNTCTQFYYIADNPSKDFIAPNALGWHSICLNGNHYNIHSQNISRVSKEYLPDHYVNSLNDIYTC